MQKHDHEVQTRFYLVLEDQGIIWVGEAKREVSPEMVVRVPAGYAHRMENMGHGDFILLSETGY